MLRANVDRLLADAGPARRADPVQRQRSPLATSTPCSCTSSPNAASPR
ncbi:MAG: hypothetical protein R2695_19590 [Acidimicrobiales bacterium]